jgi:soluble lytic murein transglycosylase-like protein
MRRTLVATGLAALCAGLALVPSGDARADIYTYTDADGVVHYSNTPPDQRRGVRRIRTSSRAQSQARGSGRSRGPRNTSPDRYSRYDAYIREAAALYQLPEAFIRAVIRVESDYHPEVVSHCGARGLMQLMPATAARMGVTDPFDPRQNIMGGTRYLRILANQFNGDLVLTIAAYNAGEGAVLRYRGIPPYEETQRYVRRVLRWYYGFLEAESNGRAATVRRASR